MMVCVCGGEVNGGTWKRPASYLHEKATPGGWTGGMFRNSKIRNLRFGFFFKGWTLSMLFRRMERMNYLLKIVISIVAVCTIHPGVWMFSSLLSSFVNFQRGSN